MGMFDKPQYLTGREGAYVEPGETFWLHNARIDGQTTVNGRTMDQAKLKVSKTRNGEQSVIFTSGAGVVGQVRRMDDGDRASMPFEVRLDQIPSQKGNPTNVLTPADQPIASAPTTDDDIPF